MKPNKHTVRISPTRLLRSVVVVIALMLSGATHADDTCYLNIHGMSSVFDQSYPVDEVQKLVFSQEALSVYFTDNPAYYEILYDDLLKITFGEQEYTDVASVEVTQLTISYASATATATVESNTAIDQVALYNTQGVLLHFASPHATSATIDLSGQPSGIYIVRAVSSDEIETLKVIK